MNKKKFILGIFITVLGGVIMIVSMVLGIVTVAKGLYEDVYVFPVTLSISTENLKTNSFTAKKGKGFSLWLKVPDRRMENKDFQISGSFINQKAEVIGDFKENFKLGYLRNSFGRGQYYKLGVCRFERDFQGWINYTIGGKWSPPYNGFLVIRQRKSFSFPVREIGVFGVGILLFIIGVGTVVKNRVG
ncbi:hypothetical protein KAI68_03660 [bacterium]|nr:hypothetical protein [bacterium]